MNIYKNTIKPNMKQRFGNMFTKNISGLFYRFKKSKDGVGALEFAIVVPFLLILYVGALEVSVAISVSKKVVKATAITADLISQSTTTNKTALRQMVGVAKSIIAPFDSRTTRLQVVGIKIDKAKVARVAWSWDQSKKRPVPFNSIIQIPEAYRISDTFLIQTTANLDHNLMLAAPDGLGIGFISRKITMGKVYYLHQREAKEIKCSDC